MKEERLPKWKREKYLLSAHGSYELRTGQLKYIPFEQDFSNRSAIFQSKVKGFFKRQSNLLNLGMDSCIRNHRELWKVSNYPEQVVRAAFIENEPVWVRKCSPRIRKSLLLWWIRARLQQFELNRERVFSLIRKANGKPFLFHTQSSWLTISQQSNVLGVS